MSKRTERVNSLIRDEISNIIQKEIDLPPDVMLSVIRVETSSNLSEAKIFISILPEKKATEVIKILEKEIYSIQQKINKHLKMRPVPKIKFLIDKTISEANRIESILNSLKNKEK